MTMLRRDGMLKVDQGITTPYEVMRVLFTLDSLSGSSASEESGTVQTDTEESEAAERGIVA